MGFKKGISLIMLVITIIVIIILAGAIILSLVQNNIIGKANEAESKDTFREYEKELLLWIAREYEITLGTLDISTVNATKDSGTYTKDSNILKLKDIITSMKSEHEDVLEIGEGKLVYIGTNPEEVEWAEEIGVSTNNGGSGGDGSLRVIQLVGGLYGSAALMEDGTVKVWGDNTYGQYGNGNYESNVLMNTVPGLTNVKQIALSDLHLMALMENGEVKVWGYNNRGQLGNGTLLNSNLPITVEGVTDVKQVAAGQCFSLALLNDGTVKSWGYNTSGQLGDETFVSKSAVTTVKGLTNVKKISAGDYHAMALLNDGTVKIWGDNGSSQLGNGLTADSNLPILIPDLINIKDIAACGFHSFAILNDGSVKGWGSNWYGQLGIGSWDESNVPVVVPDLINVKQIVGGYDHTLALLNDGTVKAFGSNYDGQLGDNTNEEKWLPITIEGLTNVAQLDTGWYHSLAILNNGLVKVWGNNEYGKLGDITTEDRYTPTQINLNYVDTLPANVIYSQSGGEFHSLKVTAVDVGGSGIDDSTLQYVWDTQNTIKPISGWEPFANEGTIARGNLDETEYLWITSTDKSNNSIVTTSGEFTPAPGVVVNSPVLATGMTAKKWDGSTWITVNNPDTDTSWYDYRGNRWANAQTADGSMWVWIPRYEYSIPIPHSSQTQTIAINFLNNTETTATDGYTVHPAFTFGTVQLPGIWVAKFEASGTTTGVNIKPDATAITMQTINNIFNACRRMETTYGARYGWGTSGTGIDTHLMKNIEWGAVAYLSQSIYGKNSEIWSNPSSSRLTGKSGSNTNTTYTTLTYSYNTLNGVNASTTGNIYGVYDMRGGVNEYTAAYVNNGNSYLTTYGLSLVNATNEYKDVYVSGGDTESGNYAANSDKKGDAVYETSDYSTYLNSWFDKISYMPYGSSPFFNFGNSSNSIHLSGIFEFGKIFGTTRGDVGFRPVLAVSASL